MAVVALAANGTGNSGTLAADTIFYVEEGEVELSTDAGHDVYPVAARPGRQVLVRADFVPLAQSQADRCGSGNFTCRSDMKSLLRTGFYRTILGATALSSAAAGDPYAPLVDLFSASEAGEVWPVHEDYLFTDAACTTPVSAVGQQVMAWPEMASRLCRQILAGCRCIAANLLGGWTQQFVQTDTLSASDWFKTRASVTGGQADFDGGTDAWLIQTTSSGGGASPHRGATGLGHIPRW